MRLVLHPQSRCDAVSRIEVEAMRPAPERLALRYVLSGVTAGLVLPAPAPPDRTDGLWRTTCFEAFVRPIPGGAYREFNFAPSSQWAAYRFDRRREGMAQALDIADPHIETVVSEDRLELRATIVFDSPNDWRVGLSAVIEEAGGRISYWALAHPPGKPDFHDPDCFTLALPASGMA